MKEIYERVRVLEAALSAQKMAYETMRNVFEGLINHAQPGAQAPMQQPAEEEDVVYTIIPPSDGSESQHNQE